MAAGGALALSTIGTACAAVDATALSPRPGGPEVALHVPSPPHAPLSGASRAAAPVDLDLPRPGRSGALVPTEPDATQATTRTAGPPGAAAASDPLPAAASPGSPPGTAPASPATRPVDSSATPLPPPAAADETNTAAARPSPAPGRPDIHVHEAPAAAGKVEVDINAGRAGGPEHVELDLPSLEQEQEAIREALPDGGASTADAEAEPEFDIPIVVNSQVERWMDYFQTVGRKHMALWLARSERYIPMMQGILREHGLPTDLVYLALIESGFSIAARSRARAVGPWQFIEGTARRYGLRIDWWIDERRDPEKSTVAAANYLKDLYAMFNSWYLAAAGYNAGEFKIVRAIARYDTEDFWEIAERRYLAAETRQYVPKLIAAAIIAKSPERYGFVDIEYQEPLVYDKVAVPDATDLRLIAQAAETTFEEVKRLNPELLRWATPPDYPGYEVKIPFGKKEVFERNFGSIDPSRRITYRRHVVRRGDTLSAIAARYGIEMAQIRRMNGLRGSLLRVGQGLVVPLPASRGVIVADADGEPRRLPPGRRTVASAKRSPSAVDAGRPAKVSRVEKAEKPTRTIHYTVRRGDTLWDLAERYDVSVVDLRRWNGFSRRHVLKAGERIKIRVPADGPRKEAQRPARRA